MQRFQREPKGLVPRGVLTAFLLCVESSRVKEKDQSLEIPHNERVLTWSPHFALEVLIQGEETERVTSTIGQSMLTHGLSWTKFGNQQPCFGTFVSPSASPGAGSGRWLATSLATKSCEKRKENHSHTRQVGSASACCSSRVSCCQDLTAQACGPGHIIPAESVQTST